MTLLAVIPDLHLNGSIILPTIQSTLKKENYKPDMYIFLGDYFDQYGVESDYDLSKRECDTLLDFKKNHNCKFLLGNHDIPYLITDIQHFSDKSPKISMLYQDTLASLGVSLAYEKDDYLFTHAGLVRDRVYDIDTETINHNNFDDYLSYLNQIESDASKSSGGSALVPSMVWARDDDWGPQLNKEYKHQIFGHTPVKTQMIRVSDDRTARYTDTFSLTYTPILHDDYNIYRPYGDGSFNLIDTTTNEVKTLQTNWTSSHMFTVINKHLNNIKSIDNVTNTVNNLYTKINTKNIQNKEL